MMNSLVHPLLPLFLAESIFGLVYAGVIHWISVKNYLIGSTAYWVVIGDAITLFILWLFFREAWSPWVTFLCFGCTGTAIVVTYLFRHQTIMEKKKHTRRPWPKHASDMRDDALMSITKIIADIEGAAKNERITAGFLLGVTNDLHLVK